MKILKSLLLISLINIAYAEINWKPNGNLLSVGLGGGVEPVTHWVAYITPTRFTQISFSGLKDFGKNNFSGKYNLILKIGDFDNEKFYNPYLGIGYGLHFDESISFLDSTYSQSKSSPKIGIGSNFSFGKARRFGINLGYYYSFPIDKGDVNPKLLEYSNDKFYESQFIPSISFVVNFLNLSTN